MGQMCRRVRSAPFIRMLGYMFLFVPFAVLLVILPFLTVILDYDLSQFP